MNIRRIKYFLFVFVVLLSACAKPAQTIPATATLPPPTLTSAPPTTTPTETPTEEPTLAPTEVPLNTDPLLFGAIGQGEIQAFSLEPVVQAIFQKALDGFVADGSVQEYQITGVTVFPGSGGLTAEVYFNIRSANAMWLEDGGTQAADGWVNDKCNRFDFVTTETEFQLKNRRMCS